MHWSQCWGRSNRSGETFFFGLVNFFLVIFTQNNELRYRLVKPGRLFFFNLPKKSSPFMSCCKGMIFFFFNLHEMSNFIFNFKFLMKFSLQTKRKIKAVQRQTE